LFAESTTVGRPGLLEASSSASGESNTVAAKVSRGGSDANGGRRMNADDGLAARRETHTAALIAADQCALLVPMDTTKMIGATDDQSHRHNV
jgi:hypothetical protein